MKNERVAYIDVLRVISIFAVIIIHVITQIKTTYYTIDINSWWVGNIYNSISKWAVPVMIMVSGTLLLDPKKEYSIYMFFRKRFNKVLIPFIFWGITYTIWKYRYTNVDIQLIIDVVENFLIGPVYYHLWFVYVILGLYLSTPIMRVYIKNATDDNIKYFLTIWFISSIILIISIAKNIRPYIEIHFFTGFIGYYILGYYLNKIQTNNINTKLLYSILLISIISTMLGTFILTKKSGTFSELAANAFAPNIIIASMCIFVAIKNIDWNRIYDNNIRLNGYILEISALSFGIYLVHVLILELLGLMKFDTTMYNPILSIPFVSMIVFVISYIIIKLMKGVPIIESFVP